MNTITLLASKGFEGTSIRQVAAAANVQPSVLYHYFPDKSSLLREVRNHINKLLRTGMSQLTDPTAGGLLRKQLVYQFEQRELITAVLQYFIAAKSDFPLGDEGYIPAAAYRHNLAVIEQGLTEGRYHSLNPVSDAKMISHLVNGFLLEYAEQPLPKKTLLKLVEQIAIFIERSLSAPQTQGISNE